MITKETSILGVVRKLGSIFGTSKKKSKKTELTKHPIEYYMQGFAFCPDCGALIALNELTPLEMFHCPLCNKMSFAPKKVGNFWLFEPIGGGGMGAVYKAYHQKYQDDLFAVKILPRNQLRNTIAIEALLAEAEIARDLDVFPYIACLVSSGRKDKEYYFAMEFIKGKRLDYKIEELGKIPQLDAILYLLQILAADAHIYKCGYLYRDLKPQNIIIDKTGNAILFDYGICMKKEEARRYGGDLVQGSPYYLPPERMEGAGEDMYSEIYSMGHLMFHMLTGHTYFEGKTIQGLAKKHVFHMKLEYDRKEFKDIDPELIEVLKDMMHRNPASRPQSFVELETSLFNIYERLEKRQKLLSKVSA